MVKPLRPLSLSFVLCILLLTVQAATALQEAIYINCGGDTETGTDNNQWIHDKPFLATGGSVDKDSTDIAQTTNDVIYQSNRWFGFSHGSSPGYDIPDLARGLYTVRLHFAEIHFSGANKRIFNVSVQDVPDETPLDIYAEAGGKYTAMVRAYANVEVADDGTLKIRLPRGTHNNPSISAIEIVPEETATSAPTPLPEPTAFDPIRINCGTKEDFTDSAGNVWKPDDYNGGNGAVHTSRDSCLKNTEIVDKYLCSERYFNQWRHTTPFAYEIPVPNGLVTVALIFAEIYHDSAGKRFFQVWVEGTLVHEGLDIYAEAGGQNVELSIKPNTPFLVRDEYLTIRLVHLDGGGNPKINGIVVSPYEAAPGTPFPTVAPTTSPAPVAAPTAVPTPIPTIQPTGAPTTTRAPVAAPSAVPTPIPTSYTEFPIDPIRINCGEDEPYTDPDDGTVWSADQYFSNSGTDRRCPNGSNLLYCTERFWNKWHGHQLPGTYEIPMPYQSGVYAVALHFAETHFEAVGRRFFSVWVEGIEIRESLDIFAEAGGKNVPLVIKEQIAVIDGYLTIEFFDIKHGNNPKISGIEITTAYGKPTLTIAPTPAPTDPVPGKWIETDANATLVARHEAAFVMVGRKAYLVGGRGNKPLDIYDPVTRTWSTGASPPKMMHHMQAVAAQGKLWLMSPWTGWYPEEVNIEFAYMYDPSTDHWYTKKALPEPRRRGGAAVIVSEDEKFIYVSHGNRGGHQTTDPERGEFAVSLAWLDRYDIAKDSWEQLADGNYPRDHTGGAMVNGRVCVAGGRDGGVAEPEKWPPVAETECYDPPTNTWQTEAPFPYPRGGSSYGQSCDGKLLVAGGEGGGIWDRVDAFDGKVWRKWDSLNIARHGTGLAVDCVCDAIYIASGSAGQGGGPEVPSVETFFPEGVDTPCNA